MVGGIIDIPLPHMVADITVIIQWVACSLFSLLHACLAVSLTSSHSEALCWSSLTLSLF